MFDMQNQGLRPFDTEEALDLLRQVYSHPGPLGHATGFAKLDMLSGGLKKGELTVVAARPSMGKCLGVDTPVMRFDGRVVAVQDVRVGDLLMGPDSRPRRVLSTTRGRGPLYRVTPIKGEPYVVNDAHILSLRMSTTTDKAHHKGDILNIAVTDYLALPSRIRAKAKGWRVGVDFAEAPVKLDPYFLGLWLGDGHTASQKITTMDSPTVSYLRGMAEALGLRLSVENNAEGNQSKNYMLARKGGSAPNPIKSALRSYGLLGNKHIPHAYLANSRQVRLKLLAGIIDTDGWLEYGCFRVTTKLENLADDYTRLARSLGFAAYKKAVTKRIAARGFSGQYWTVTISGEIGEVPTLMPHKQERPGDRHRRKDVTNVGISVAPIGEGDYYGFEIDGDRLFLLGDFTVTHNTAIALCIAMNMAREGKPVFIFSQEMSQRQLLWRMAGIESGISSTAITNGFFYRGQERVPLEAEAYRNFANAIKAVAALPLRVFDSLISTEKMFKEIEREIGDNNPPAMVIDDYLQLHLDTQGSNDTERLTLVTRNLKAMTLHFNIPLIAISQLSRAVEVRGGDFTPMLSDLRSSGSIEQDADVVWFLKRPEYYNAAERSNAGLAEVIIAKNRNGETGATRLHFDSRTTRFTDWQGRI